MIEGLYRLYQIIGIIIVTTSILIAYGVIPNPIPSTPFKPSGILAITNVNVIPMDEERVLPHQTVIVRDGRIALMRDSDDVNIPNNAEEIDGSDKYLIPGLIDAHVYLQSQNMIENFGLKLDHLIVDYEQCLLPYVAHGVTSVRVMSAVPEHIEIQERVKIGNMLGPRMLTSLGVTQSQRSYEGPYDRLVSTPREARQAVRLAEEEGFDMINFTAPMSPDALAALLDAAGRHDLAVEGSILPVDLQSQDLLAMGIDGLYGYYGLVEPMGELNPRVLQGLLMNDLHVTSVLWIFTNLIERSELAGAERESLEDANTCPIFTEYIWDYVEGGSPNVTPEIVQQRVDFRNWLRGLTAQLHMSGVPVIAGSFSSLGRAVPGYSLHDELQELYAAGLTTFDALRAATSTPASVIPQFSDSGVIEPGKRADLLLLNSNPLDNIENTRDIEGVVVNGNWWPRNLLEELLEAERAESAEMSTEGD